ncbi:hypothetical protein FB451DRAFT_1172457 [Mycena latifolia]|nr:hypothetical protein FB451DRAFT_1172457 [Mycena latifolia]
MQLLAAEGLEISAWKHKGTSVLLNEVLGTYEDIHLKPWKYVMEGSEPIESTVQVPMVGGIYMPWIANLGNIELLQLMKDPGTGPTVLKEVEPPRISLHKTLFDMLNPKKYDVLRNILGL